MELVVFFFISLLVNLRCCGGSFASEDETLVRHSRAAKEALTYEGFKKRCISHMAHLPEQFKSPSEEDCNAWWQLFVKIIRCDGQCKRNDTTMYKDLVERIPPEFGDGEKVTFWAGDGVATRVAKIANSFNPMYYTLEQTRLGYMLNGLWWCCAENETVTYLRSDCKACDKQLDKNFWSAASKKYAELASGNVHTLLDGSKSDTPYHPASFFSIYEVPNINRVKSSVTNMDIHITYNDYNKDVKSNCSSPSIGILNRTLDKISVSTTCKENEFSDIHCSSRRKRAAATGFQLGQCIRPSILDIPIDEKRLSTLGIVLITIASIVVICIIVVGLIMYFKLKEDD